MTRSITKIFLLTSAGLFFLFSAFAGIGNTNKAASQQNNWQFSNTPLLSNQANVQTTSNVPASIEAAPGVQMPTGKGQGFNKAPFDIDLQWAVGDTTGGVSLTGVAFTGTEFWISQWNSDTLRALNSNGTFNSAFTVPGGPTSIRSLTWDGTSIYAGGAGSSIWQINPTTKALTSTITIAGGNVGARMCAYDPNADSGNGGFWIGNFTSDIQLISMSGAILTTITQATHGITGMYGGAVDTFTAGGPYLLVYAQDGPSQNTITWIDLNTNTPTGVTYDVNADVPVAGIAGGLFVADGIIPGEQHILAMTQDAAGTLTGYELGLPPAPAGEIELLASPTGGILNNALVPEDQATSGPQALTALASPVAGGPFDSAQITTTLSPGSIALSSPFATVAPGAAVALTTNTFTATAGTNYTGTINLTATSDTDPLNNAYSVDMTVSDTVLARENATVNTGELSFSATNYIGNVIELVGQDTLTSLSCYFTAAAGITYPITASIAILDYNAGPGNFAIFQTPVLTIPAAGLFTVSVPSIILTPGAYFVGAQEQGSFLPLGTDNSVSYNGVSIGGPLGGVNIDVRDFGFFETFMARANFSDVVASNLSPFTLTAPADGTILDVMGAGTQTVNITWNASTATPAATVTYEWLLDLQGGNFSNPLATIPAGTATNLTLTYQDIDNLLASLNVPIGNTVQTSWTVRASAPAANLLATASFDLDLIRSGLTPTSGSRDFEAYNAGDLIVASDSEWEFWPGATLDAPVSIAQSQSGTNSLLVDGAPAQDLVFKLGDQTSGTWGVGMSFYIPSGNGAYYNLQETEVPGVTWPIGNVVFDPAGTGVVDGVTPAANFTFPHDTWFDIRNYVDLDNDTFQVWIDNSLVASGVWTDAGGALQLGGINIFPDGAGGATPANKVWYIDDMYFQPDSLRTPVTYSFSPYNLTSPPDQTRLEVEANNTTPVVIDWDATTVTPSATPEYRWLLDVQGGTFTSPLLDIDADNNGTDSQLTLTSGAIDTELANLGIQPGDSVDVIWTVEASVFGQGAFAANGPFDIRLVRKDASGLGSSAIANNISFFPNPTTGQLVVKVRENAVNNVMIQSMIGQNLKSFEINSTTNVLDLSDLSSGLYIIRFVSENQEYSQKLIIE